ncbi:site-specific DNA-methyltransferase [Candidatus Bathyarchaeota archaeon]|nr:site-specific DNA-methyltransferase [Candidatus Bathyarchaeota archaeon]
MVELVWEHKYDKTGAKSAPVQVALPFQTIETLNESSIQRQKSIDVFFSGRGEPEWKNRLIWGDKKYVLPSLLPEFANSVDLIYIDPPFDTGADFSYRVEVPDHQVDETSFTKLPSVIEQKAYRDTWGEGPTQIDSYLRWFYETLVFLQKLLKPTGSIWVHLDWHVGQYAKVLLDEVFGKDNFRNEVIRIKSNPKNYTSNAFGNIHDVIYFYSKTDAYVWNRIFQSRDEEQVKKDFPLMEPETGRRYKTAPIHASEIRRGSTGERWRGLMPPAGHHWRYTPDTLDKLVSENRIAWSSTGNPREKIYADESPGYAVQDVWTDFKDVSQSVYPTAKNEKILDTIIRAATKTDCLVADFFCGSGTTAVVAEQLGRRWIVCDLSRFAIHTTRKRLLNVQNVKPFVIQNLGKYERQVWQAAEFGDEAKTRVRSYIGFILKLYNAQPLNGYLWLHGKKGNRLVHVGSVDSPISPLDVGQIVAEFKRSTGTGKEDHQVNGVDILGWDFAFELNELAKLQAAQANVDVRFLRIPREVLDKKAIEQGDIRFFELACLDVGVETSEKKVTITLNDFVIPADDVPADIQKEIKHWSQWVDYWSIDWNNKNDTFHNEWQEYRTREKPSLSARARQLTYAVQGHPHIVRLLSPPPSQL